MLQNNRMKRSALLILFIALRVDPAHAQVTRERLLKASDEPHNWLTYSGDYASRRYSMLKQINKATVERLEKRWSFRMESAERFETTPLVIDGLMYVTGPANRAYALDARTGRLIWSYDRKLTERGIIACCGRVNRGFAALGGLLFLATLDAHLVALDAKTGETVWDVEAEDPRKGYSFTLAPLVVKDKIIVGVSGGEFGIRGFIDAYDAQTGKRAWRFYTIPGPGEPGNETWDGDSWRTGGAPAWVTGAYDPELNLIYWGTGNPSPSYTPEYRRGDNLYSDSLVALDADTGKLKWHFQFTPGDMHDWDATQIPVLLDADFDGRPRKLIMQANRNGFFYVLDRTNGKFLLAKQFARQTWAKEIDAGGRPVLLPGATPTPKGTYVCPGGEGGSNWMSPSYSPDVNLFYVPVREHCDIFRSVEMKYQAGRWYTGGEFSQPPGEKDWGALRAIDPGTGEIKWEYKYSSAPFGGALSTAGGVVFAGDSEGYFRAFDTRTGKVLWTSSKGGEVRSSPITYGVAGTQYVAVASGNILNVFAISESAGGIK
jgi:alcohol dehydrogenase (cytochrome c)